MNGPKLSFNSPEWLIVEEWLADQLEETYRRLASLHLEERETQQLRGRAAFISQMLDLRNIPTTRRP
jgi:hypothetical protein